MSVILLGWTFDGEPRVASYGVFENVEQRIETGLSHLSKCGYDDFHVAIVPLDEFMFLKISKTL